MNQQCEQEALHAAQKEQELRKQEQAAQEKEEPPQNFDFRQLIGEICGTKVCEAQKQNKEDTMLELLEDCRQKELYCMHNDVEDLIESALNSKLLLINLKSKRLDKEKQEVKNIVEQPTKRRTRLTKCLKNFKVIRKKSSISLNNTSQISPVNAIVPVLPTEEPDNSLSMGDEHLSTIPKMESDEVIESSVENLVPIPSQSEVTSDNEKIISTKIDPHYFNVESDLIESFLNQDTLIESSPKFDYLLEEFSGELAHINLIPPEIEEADFNLEGEIHLVENLLYDNSFPRPPEELNPEIDDTILESLSPFPIPIEDYDSKMEEIDLFLATDDLMPPSIENNDYDSEGDIHFLKELLSDDPFPIPKNESSNFDHHDDPSFPRSPPEPPDVEILFDFEPDTGVLTTKMVED
nr:hypothetical protein [Tanacetum cinerariifolium]